MRLLAASLLSLLLLSPIYPQERYGLAPGPTKEKLADAAKVLASVNNNPIAMPYGGYALIDIDVTGELVPYIVPGSDECLDIELIPKGKSTKQWHVKKGDAEFSWVTIPADDKVDRLKVSGIEKGSQTILWMSVANGKPYVVKGYKFDIGPQKPKPKPDDPVIPDDPLVKSFKDALSKDVLAGKGDKKWILPLAGIYEAAGNDSLESMATMGDLDNVLLSARQKAGIPDPEVQLLNLRKAMQSELYQQLGINKDSASVPFKPDTRRLAKATLLKIATALEAIAQ